MIEDANKLGNLIAVPLQIGGLHLPGRAFLAPMAGVTDLGMRRLAARFGSALTVSEMVAADRYFRGDAASQLKAEGAGMGLHVVQIAGCDPYVMAEAARLAQDCGAAMIDINMGVPRKKGHKRIWRVASDARSSARGLACSRHGRRRAYTSHAQNAAWLG